MLALISLDAVARPLIDRMIAQGRLPNLASLESRGRHYPLRSTLVPASVYRSLYDGSRLATHGMHYPFQWCAAEQRVKRTSPPDPLATIFARLDAAGKPMLILDPPEGGQYAPRHGAALSGWQFHARLVLPEWSSMPAFSAALRQRFGPPEGCHEVFGAPSPARLQSLRRVLEASPARLAAAAIEGLRQISPDLLWITFAGAHIAGHQFWDNGLEPFYEQTDTALGQVLAALPAGASILVFSPNGMGPETSRADLLPGMLTRVLGGKSRAESPLWRIRSLVPSSLRARVADALPEALSLRITAGLEDVRADWTTTRAFALPSDGPGFVRLNLLGRERHGIVPPGQAEALLAEIESGLRTFLEPSGQPAVANVLRARDLDGDGPQTGALPDLIVEWNSTPSGALRQLDSATFGTVLRHGSGSGRTGNHCAGTWVTVAAGNGSTYTPVTEPVQIVDLPATVCAALDIDHSDLPGRPLLL